MAEIPHPTESEPKAEIHQGKYPTRNSVSTRSQLQTNIQQTLNQPLGFKSLKNSNNTPLDSDPQKPLGDNQNNNFPQNNNEGHDPYKMDVENPDQLRKTSFTDDRKLNKRPKRRKVLIKEPQDFLPEFLVFISQFHYKHTIREGWRYQADIPEQKGNYRQVTKLVKIREGSQDFDNDVLREFKVKFGQNRTQEELCSIKQQLNCTWRQIPRYLEANRDAYKRVFKDKDRTQMKAIKTIN